MHLGGHGCAHMQIVDIMDKESKDILLCFVLWYLLMGMSKDGLEILEESIRAIFFPHSHLL